MEITRCRHCGFCPGVRRAIAMAEGLRRRDLNVFVDGDLVHNPTVLHNLRMAGIHRWDGEERQWGHHDCLLIRAHGISPERRTALRQLCCPIFDGTCPEVARVAGLIRRLNRMGYFLLLHGDRQHPEIIGLAGYGGGNLAVVGTEEDLITAAARVEGRPTALLAQTTDGMEQFTVFARLAEGYFPNLQVHMTICRGTVERRNELATNLATGNFDLTVVIGGLQSSNSLALAELARRGNGRVLHLENAAALARYLPLKAGNILIASGTSTPSEEVDAVEAIFRTLPVNLESPPGQVGTI